MLASSQEIVLQLQSIETLSNRTLNNRIQIWAPIDDCLQAYQRAPNPFRWDKLDCTIDPIPNNSNLQSLEDVPYTFLRQGTQLTFVSIKINYKTENYGDCCWFANWTKGLMVVNSTFWSNALATNWTFYLSTLSSSCCLTLDTFVTVHNNDK
jgi:hypothetical protein